jgi:hypothetical protein
MGKKKPSISDESPILKHQVGAMTDLENWRKKKAVTS